MREQPLAFLVAHRHALEIMIGDLAGEVAGIEVGGAQAPFDAGDRHARRGVGVRDAMRIGQMAVEQRMLDEAGTVHRIGRVVELVAVDVDLDQVRRLHFAEVQPERVDQEGAFLARHLQRDVIVDHLGPAEHVEHAVAGGELLAGLPLGSGHGGIAQRGGHHTSPKAFFVDRVCHARGGACNCCRLRPAQRSAF